ncbi:hypothetical protein MRX96_021533 [Rhipicephalus microplus]
MNLPVTTYTPALDDFIRRVVYKAYTDETDHDLQAQLMKKNPDTLIVIARRPGSSKHLVITFAGLKLPATIHFRCFTLEVHPFRERPEACFNCRKLGHRTGDIRFYASNTQQQERLEQRPTKERKLEYQRSRANQQSGNYSASIQHQTRGQDQEPVNILDSRWPFQIQFEIKDAATSQTSRQSDLGRGLLLSENPHLRARFQIVHRRRDERRKVLAWRGRALSGYRLPSDGSFTRPLTPCCCYVVSTPDIYPTTITSSQGRNQPTASWSPSTATPGTRPAALGEPAPTREVPDCPPPSRRASQGPGLARTSPVWLPATERRFVHSALNPCCCYVVSTPDIYPTTITSSQGRNQPTASWSPSTAT